MTAEHQLRRCDLCEGTAIRTVDDGDGYWDEVECHLCINGWVTEDGKYPRGELARIAGSIPVRLR